MRTNAELIAEARDASVDERFSGDGDGELYSDLADALARMEAERDAALASVAELAAALPDILDAAESDVYRIQGEWGVGSVPDDDEDIVAINAVRAILAKATK